MAILPIGFFMPLPLAMMIPFMGIQSAVMMKQAGENWQYGKRLQSAMSNEDFNKQTMESIFEKNTKSVAAMIPTMKQSIQEMRGFQDFIIVEIIELMRRGLETGLGAIFGMTAQESNQFFGGTTGPALITDDTPVGTTTPEGITLTIEEIQSMSFQALSFETQLSQIGKYTEATQAHMLTELQNKKASDQEVRETETEISDLRSAFRVTETQFLQTLTTVTLAGFWTPYLTSFDEDSQSRIIAALRQFGWSAGYNTLRTQSSASDEVLTQLRGILAEARRIFLAGPDEFKQIKINEIHVVIWFHQLIYSR